jgi:hypothetical protein
LSRSNDLGALAALSLLSAISGCQKPADQAATPDSASNSPNDSANNSSGGSATREAPAASPLVIPAHTAITVVLKETLGSTTSSTGQNFSATVSSPVEVDGRIAIAKGAHAMGIVRDAKPAGRFKGGAVLTIALTSVTLDHARYDIRTANRTQLSKGKGKRSAAMIGGGGAAGALIGGLAGGGKGAAIGVGVGAGTGGAGLTGNREIVLPVETPLTFKLLVPL